MGLRMCGRSAVLAIFILAIIVVGYDHFMEGRKFKAPKTITFEQFVRERPTEGWFIVTGACLSVIEGANIVKKSDDSDVETADTSHLFIPMRSTTHTEQAAGKSAPTIKVLVKTSRADAIHMYFGLKAIPEKKLGSLKPDQMFLFSDIEGMIGPELHSGDLSEESALTKAMPGLAPGFIMFDEGAKPSVALGAAMLFGGIAIVALLILQSVLGSIRSKTD